MNTQTQLLIVVALIFAAGLVMIFNTTSAEVLDWDLNRSTHQALMKQLAYGLLGGAIAWGCWAFGYQKAIMHSLPILAFLTFLLVLCLIPGIGISRNGSRRWVGLATISLQPSEFVKYASAMFYIQAYILQKSSEFPFKTFIRTLGILAIPIVLVLLQPNNGTAAVIALTLMLLFFLSGVRFRYWGMPMICLGLIGLTVASQLPYVRARVYSYMHPEADLKGKGHQPWQAKIAAGSGGIWGKGPGQSLQKLSYLPEAQNDYIAAIFAEEYGFVGILLLICSYAWLACLGFRIACLSPDKGGFYLAAAITFLISFQAFMNLGVVSGLLPSTGLNLPFFSQGGSSLMAHLAAIGLLLSICKEGRCTEKLIS